MSSLIINPEVGQFEGPDEPLWYVVPYFEQIRDYLAAKGQAITYLYREDAVKDKIWRAIQTRRPAFIIAAGHGRETFYTAYKGETVFWVDMLAEGFTPDWTKQTVFLMLSCLTAAYLGPWMVNSNAAWSYLGWTQEYYIGLKIGVRKGDNPYDSPDLLFLKPLEEAFERCAAGEISPREAYNHIYQKYTEYASDPTLPPDVRAHILHDRDTMVLLGMKISPIQRPLPILPFAAGFLFTLGTVNILSGGKVLSP